MTPKRLYTLLLTLVAVGAVAGQSEDIPIENDNQFPPETPAAKEEPLIEGSGDGTIDEQQVTIFTSSDTTPAATETTPVPQLEEVQPTSLITDDVTTQSEDQSCPKPCVCHYEGGSDNFVVDCSGYELTEFPSPIDSKTTTLNIQNNKLAEIPKTVSTLKNLKVLNAENNSIMDLALGSVSELSELIVLKLGNNRLIEYPKDLKNSLSLTKLQELDLGRNDMRTELKPEEFSNFATLRKLTLATSTPELLQNLCSTLKTSLETVCTESCENQFYECEGAPQESEDDLLDATLPGLIPFDGEENSDPAIQSSNIDTSSLSVATENTPRLSGENQDSVADTTDEPSLTRLQNIASMSAGRAMISNAPEDTISQKSGSIVETPAEETTKSEAAVKVGATTTTTEEKSGAVSKSVIGIVVAAMVVIVAVVAIKKNWSSIRKRFSSSPRPGERAGANSNGTAPEEVPLQDKDKSPV